MEHEIPTQIEAHSKDFVERCLSAHEQKLVLEESEQKLIALLAEIVEKVDRVCSRPSLPSTLDTGSEPLVLPVATTEEQIKFRPQHTVFDAIPINSANLSVLCTPAYVAGAWKVENIAENALGEVTACIMAMCDDLQKEHTATRWELAMEGSGADVVLEGSTPSGSSLPLAIERKDVSTLAGEVFPEKPKQDTVVLQEKLHSMVDTNAGATEQSVRSGTSKESIKFLGFTLEQSEFLVPMVDIIRIVPWQPSIIIPRQESDICGILHMEHYSIPAVSMYSCLLNKEIPKDRRDSGYIIICSYCSSEIGILVDGTTKIYSFYADDIQPNLSTTSTVSSDIISGIIVEEHLFFPIVSVKAIYSFFDRIAVE